MSSVADLIVILLLGAFTSGLVALLANAVDAGETPADRRTRQQRWLVRWIDRPCEILWRPFGDFARWVGRSASRGTRWFAQRRDDG